MDEPDTALDFIRLELCPQGFKSGLEARLGQQILPEVRQLDPAPFRAQGQALATELDRAGNEVSIRGASVLVAQVTGDDEPRCDHGPIYCRHLRFAQDFKGDVLPVSGGGLSA